MRTIDPFFPRSNFNDHIANKFATLYGGQHIDYVRDLVERWRLNSNQNWLEFLNHVDIHVRINWSLSSLLNNVLQIDLMFGWHHMNRDVLNMKTNAMTTKNRKTGFSTVDTESIQRLLNFKRFELLSTFRKNEKNMYA